MKKKLQNRGKIYFNGIDSHIGYIVVGGSELAHPGRSYAIGWHVRASSLDSELIQPREVQQHQQSCGYNLIGKNEGSYTKEPTSRRSHDSQVKGGPSTTPLYTHKRERNSSNGLKARKSWLLGATARILIGGNLSGPLVTTRRSHSDNTLSLSRLLLCYTAAAAAAAALNSSDTFLPNLWPNYSLLLSLSYLNGLSRLFITPRPSDLSCGSFEKYV